ncbi:MAG: tetratricopeptide repeat protein [Opitutales bacterium]|jgi:tetratricopeptide (TPR) repeat protein
MGIISQVGRKAPTGRHKEAIELLEAGRAREAVMMLADLADADPFNPYICVDLGKSVLVLGMVEQAIVAARQAVELDGLNMEAFMLLAQALESKGEMAEACQALRRALDLVRNPMPPLTELEGEKVPLPLSFAEHGAVFMNFEVSGDGANLHLKSLSSDGKFCVDVRITGDTAASDLDGFSILTEGLLPQERLLQCLPEKFAFAVGLFPASTYPFTLQKKG